MCLYLIKTVQVVCWAVRQHSFQLLWAERLWLNIDDFLVCIKATNELQPPHPLPKPSHLTQFMTCFCSLLCSGKDNNIPKQTTHSSVYITLDANTQADSIIVRFLLIIQTILDFWDHPKIMLCSDDSLKTVSSFKSYRSIRRVEHGRAC